MAEELVLVRAVTRAECPWLSADIEEGVRVFAYRGCTYGCIGPAGIAVTSEPDETPFFEVPFDAVEHFSATTVSDQKDAG